MTPGIGRGAWSPSEFDPPRTPGACLRIFLRVEVPHVGATLDAVQQHPDDPHVWRVETHDAAGWRTATDVAVDNPDDLLGTVAQLLAAALKSKD